MADKKTLLDRLKEEFIVAISIVGGYALLISIYYALFEVFSLAIVLERTLYFAVFYGIVSLLSYLWKRRKA